MSTGLLLLAVLLIVLAFLLLSSYSQSEESNVSPSSQNKSLTPTEKRLQDALGDLSEFESNKSMLVEMSHGGHDSHISMRLRREHQDLVDRVRDVEKEVYGEPITPEAEDWRAFP